MSTAMRTKRSPRDLSWAMPFFLNRTTSEGLQPLDLSRDTSEPSRWVQVAVKPKRACSRLTRMTVWRSASATVCTSPSEPLCTLNSTWPGSLPGVWWPMSLTFARVFPCVAPWGTFIFTTTGASRHRSRLSCSRSAMATTWRPKGVLAYFGTWTFSGGHRPHSLQCAASGSARQPRQRTRRGNLNSLPGAPCTSSFTETGTCTSIDSPLILPSSSPFMCFGLSCAFCCSICCSNIIRWGWFFGTWLSCASIWARLPSTSLKAISMFRTSCTPPRS
mmetsp:Transcript_36171/g.81717  ORF Transcript_36171/g.81717 Transcript_36171/m.81717 type:complete len:275 (-) Transcript_36171:556-1380(-)